MNFARFLTLISITAAGCASAPHFEPSRPIERARTAQEALLSCDEYRLPDPAKRPIEFRPFLDCVTSVKEYFGVDGNLGLFADELDFEYSLLREESWTPEIGRRMALATHALLRAIATGGARSGESFTPAERNLALLYFPRTSQRIGTESWPTSVRVAFDPRLELLKAGVEALRPARSLTAGAQEGRIQPELCGRWTKLQGETTYLSALWNDSYDMQQIDAADPQAVRARERYQSRLKQAFQSLDQVRAATSLITQADGSALLSSCRQ